MAAGHVPASPEVMTGTFSPRETSAPKEKMYLLWNQHGNLPFGGKLEETIGARMRYEVCGRATSSGSLHVWAKGTQKIMQQMHSTNLGTVRLGWDIHKTPPKCTVPLLFFCIAGDLQPLRPKSMSSWACHGHVRLQPQQAVCWKATLPEKVWVIWTLIGVNGKRSSVIWPQPGAGWPCAGGVEAATISQWVYGESSLEPGGLYGVAVQSLMIRACCG